MSESETYVEPLLVKCPTCGEGVGAPCLDYSSIPFRTTKDDRKPKVMHYKAQRMAEPHKARYDKAQK